MSNLIQALNLKKENGNLSEPYLMRKLKITSGEASKLIAEVDNLMALESQQKSENRIKKFEMHITAEYH